MVDFSKRNQKRRLAIALKSKKKSDIPKGPRKRVHFENDQIQGQKRRRVDKQPASNILKPQDEPSVTPRSSIRGFFKRKMTAAVKHFQQARHAGYDHTPGGFPIPSRDVRSFDTASDWFESMYAYVSCQVSPVHVIGIKADGSKKRCDEGVGHIDAVLSKGEVNIMFHPTVGFEPVCEACWTMGAHENGTLKMPGGWPREIEDEGSAHTHIFTVNYAGCKLYNKDDGTNGHSLRLVKGSEMKGGAGKYCRCDNEGTEVGSEEKKRYGGFPVFETKILMSDFAGCPACVGKELASLVRKQNGLEIIE